MKKNKLPTLDEFEINVKNSPFNKDRSSQFKKGMIAGYIETIDMINGILNVNINGKFHPCTCTNYNGSQCYNCLNGFHEGCTGECNKNKINDKHLGVKLIFKP